MHELGEQRRQRSLAELLGGVAEPVADQLAARDRKVEVTTEHGTAEDERFEVDIAIEAYDRQGLLRDVTQLFANARINVLSIETQTNRKTNTATMRLTVEVANLGSLGKLLERLNRLNNVVSAHRLNS